MFSERRAPLQEVGRALESFFHPLPLAIPLPQERFYARKSAIERAFSSRNGSAYRKSAVERVRNSLNRTFLRTTVVFLCKRAGSRTIPRTETRKSQLRTAGFRLQHCAAPINDARLQSLALGELRALAGLLQTVLLALHHTGVAREVAGLLELGAVVAGRKQGAGDAVSQGAGLALDAAAVDAGDDVEVIHRVRHLERRERVVHQRLAAEVLQGLAAVMVTLPVPGTRRTRATAFLRRPVP